MCGNMRSGRPFAGFKSCLAFRYVGFAAIKLREVYLVNGSQLPWYDYRYFTNILYYLSCTGGTALCGWD